MTEFLREGYFVKIGDLFYQITAVEPFNYATNEGDLTEFTVISTAATSGFKDIKNLEPSESPPRLYQVRAGIQDGLDYKFKIPTGTSRWGVDEDKDVGYFDHTKTPFFEMNEDYEFWLINDYYPSVQASNAVGISVIPKVYFEGMKYDVKLVKGMDIRSGAIDPGSVADRLSKGQLSYRAITLGGVKVSE